MMYSARAVTNEAPHGERPGVEVEVLEYVGRTGWAVRGVTARSGPLNWVRWDEAQADAALAQLGWVRVADWAAGGGLYFDQVIGWDG